MSEQITVHRESAVQRITLARPEKKNALTAAMYGAIIAAMAEAQSDPACGAIMIEGSDGNFTAGNDIADFLAQAGKPEGLAALDFVRAIATCELPIVAAIEGVAVGIGTTMLFHCDLAYAASSAMFRMPFVDLGLVPEAAASLLVPARVGRVVAGQLLLLCEAFGAEQARNYGIVNDIVDAGDLPAFAFDRAKALAAKPRAALRLTRRLIRGDQDALLARIEDEARIFAERLTSKEAQQVMAAFMARAKS
jgi:enoyl-CoA hydratase/carnithine racemase